MKTIPATIKTLRILGIGLGALVMLASCAARRNLIGDGAYALAIEPELASAVDDVTATRVDNTLIIAGRMFSDPGACPDRIRIDLIDPLGRLIDSRGAAYYSRNCYSYYYIARSARHLRYHHPDRFSAIFWTLPPAGTTIRISSSK